MVNSIITINYKNRPYYIDKCDSLKTLLTHEELLLLPMTVWKEIFEQKDGMCSSNLMSQVLEASIRAYDKSINVNSFYFKEKQYWLDKATRVGLQNLANCCPNDISLFLEDTMVSLSLDKAIEFLSQLEIYAGQSFVTTAKHLLAIKELKTVQDIINYDYTAGYPNKITLNE